MEMQNDAQRKGDFFKHITSDSFPSWIISNYKLLPRNNSSHVKLFSFKRFAVLTVFIYFLSCLLSWELFSYLTF